MSTDNLLEILREIILNRVEKDTLVIPSLPEIATRCLELLREEEVDLRLVAKLVERDPVLAARLLRQATSVAAGGGDGALSIQQASVRLGSRAVRTLVLDASAQQLFRSRDERIASTVRQLWEHSVAVALLSRDVAAILGGLDAEAAYLAGLIHDIGKPIAAAILLEAERASDRGRFTLTADSWIGVVHGVHRTIGVALAEKWRLPDAVAQAIRDSSEFDSTNRHSLGNVVCFANSIAKLQGIFPGSFAREDAEALVMVGRSLLGLDDEVIARLSTGVKARIAAEGN